MFLLKYEGYENASTGKKIHQKIKKVRFCVECFCGEMFCFEKSSSLDYLIVGEPVAELLVVEPLLPQAQVEHGEGGVACHLNQEEIRGCNEIKDDIQIRTIQFFFLNKAAT